MSQPLRKILAQFTRATQTTKHFIVDLIRDAAKVFGDATYTEMMDQWRKLSKKLNSPSKLNCLHDKNHRLLIIQFMKEKEIQSYTCSYFNSAMIHPGYLEYIRNMKPCIFKEIVMIASRLKLVQKRFKQKLEQNFWIENHIDAQIRVILARFNTNKRKINSNFEKFKAIADFEDFMELAKQMGSLIRISWSKAKKDKKEEVRVASERSLTQVMVPNELSHEDLFEFQDSWAQKILDGYFP